MRERQYWALDEAGEVTEITGLKSVERDPNDIGDVLRLTDFKQPSRDTTAEVLVGQLAVPFFTIADSTRDWQIAYSPYYIVKRYGYWQQVYFYEHAGTSAVAKERR